MRAPPPPPIPLPENEINHSVSPVATDTDNSFLHPNTVDSPPITPHSSTFTQPANPFSPPASVRSFGTESAMATPSRSSFPFPEFPTHSGSSSVSTSAADLPRLSYGHSARTSTSDHYSVLSSIRPSSSGSRLRETFSPPPSRPVTLYSVPSTAKLIRERPKSTMISTTKEKPWLATRDPHSRTAYFLTYGVMFLGIIAGALKCYFDWKAVPLLKGNLCLVMDEDFSDPNEVFGDNGKFFREVDMSGFGNGEFEMTTESSNNSFIENGNLYIVPTLTSDSIPDSAILDGYIYNLTGCTFNITQGISYTGYTGDSSAPIVLNTSAVGPNVFNAEGYYKACSVVSNATSGQIINPVQSARLSTRKTASIKYGKVEVRAKIPTGDWLWPAIWMMPVDNTYGLWPLSGEIDIMESRGNGISYPRQGVNFVRGSLNWGPTLDLNAGAKTTGWWKLRRGGYNQDFHTYTLEWDEDFMRISVDSRLHHMLDLNIKQSFWDSGNFPADIHNGSDVIVLDDPWINGTKAAPFDQRFYLILDVGVGGTNGWFPDGPEKPWLDGSPTAMRDFWLAKDQWYPSWPQDINDRALVIDSVKMWQQC